MYPFERFTERAKKVLALAQEEAEKSHHSYIGTEHVLLGLLREGDGIAAKVLNNLGVEIEKVRQTIESLLGRDKGLTVLQQIIPTSRVKKVLEISFEEARRMGHNYVGSEHLLLGLLAEGEGIAAHVLGDLGATLDKVRAEIERQLHDPTLKDTEPPPKKPSKTPLLDQFGRDLTELARKNSLDPVIGREAEIERVIQILSRRTKNNPAPGRRGWRRQDRDRGGPGPADHAW
ncbi:MAG TPA: Clp protease N-terminal domain-containing protein [Candidatus Baltobacterales bacterium]|nr:Clp protease N-terminal domain-containing protein [Candidatus Baltobacterales bacterium]